MRFLSFAQISSRRQGHFQHRFLALASLWVIFCSVGNQAMSQQLRPLGFTLQASAGVPMGDFRTFASTGLGASFGGRYVLSESFTLTFDAAYTYFLNKEFVSSEFADISFRNQTSLISFLPGIRYTFEMFYVGLQAGYVLRSLNSRRIDFGIEQPLKQNPGNHWSLQPSVGALVPLGERFSLDANCAYVPVQMQGSAFPSGAVVLNLGVQMRF
jgi:hypothetical protein